MKSFEDKINSLNDNDSIEETKIINCYLNNLIKGIEKNKKDQDKIVPRWLLLGLDSSGKTTILYKLKLGKLVTTIPTVGYNDESINYNGYKIRITEIGGQGTSRYLWKNSLLKTRAIIFVVDSADSERIEEAKNKLHKLLDNENSKDCILLVYVNKQDLQEAIKPDEIKNKLELDKIQNREYYITGSCGTTGEGLYFFNTNNFIKDAKEISW